MQNRRLVLLGAVLALVTGLQAGSVVLTANIPFEFTVGKNVMPAGEYRITRAMNGANWLAISNRDGKRTDTFASPISGSEAGSQRASLVFNRFGDQYFLHKVVAYATGVVAEIPASAKEKELKKMATVKKELVILALR